MNKPFSRLYDHFKKLAKVRHDSEQARLKVFAELEEGKRRRRESAIRKVAFHLWEADGKPEGRDTYYWGKAEEHLACPLLKLYRWAGFSGKSLWDYLNLLGIPIVIALLGIGFTDIQQRSNTIQIAWQTINSASGQVGSGGRKEALEELNSQPRRIPFFWLRWKSYSLQGLQAPSAHLVNLQLPKADLRSANFEKATLAYSNLQGSDLRFANLQGANLQGADLATANLQGAILTSVNLQGATLWGTNLQGANLVDTNLQDSVLAFASLQNADLTGTITPRSVPHLFLPGANLQRTDLSGANLQGAMLQVGNSALDANFQGALYTRHNSPPKDCIPLWEADKPKFMLIASNICPTFFPTNFDPESAGMVEICSRAFLCFYLEEGLKP